MSEERTTREREARCAAENDLLRSEFVRQLIGRCPSDPRPTDGAPRLLVQFWDEATSVPQDVQECLDSWAPLEQSGFQRLLFHDSSALQFIAGHFAERYGNAFRACGHPAMRADYFRLCFILRFGGLYVDADDRYLGRDVDTVASDGRLRLQALCYDIPTGSMLDPYEAATAGENTNRVFYVNNNPLIAPAAHPLVARALERATDQLLAAGPNCRDIQSMTGPGNLTASLVEHTLALDGKGAELDFALLPNWDSIAMSQWPLEYRSDDRNWRNWCKPVDNLGQATGVSAQ